MRYSWCRAAQECICEIGVELHYGGVSAAVRETETWVPYRLLLDIKISGIKTGLLIDLVLQWLIALDRLISTWWVSVRNVEYHMGRGSKEE